MKILIKLFKKYLNKKEKVPGYLGRDLSKHRVYTTRYEDLCK
jgi:hypothetical protein